MNNGCHQPHLYLALPPTISAGHHAKGGVNVRSSLKLHINDQPQLKFGATAPCTATRAGIIAPKLRYEQHSVDACDIQTEQYSIKCEGTLCIAFA